MLGRKNTTYIFSACIGTLFAGFILSGQETDRISTLDTYVVRAGKVANESPLPTYSNPISSLVFSPQIDVQNRGFAEAQGDISIRGGTFENTGFNIGSLAIFDPQTGHYLLEAPIDPQMLQTPKVLVGFKQQLASFNANVGSVQYNWKAAYTPLRRLTLSVGENNLHTQSFYLAQPFATDHSNSAFDMSVARSESDGAIEYGDHQFQRISARIQHQTDRSQLNLFVGYQDKFFGWPNMYTPFNVQETEDIQTLLIIGDYKRNLANDSSINLAGYYRINWDDYEFDRDRPGLYNPYEHKTKVGGIHSAWTSSLNNQAQYGVIGDLFLDSIQSTTLTNSFQSRTYHQLKTFLSLPNLSESVSLDVSLSYVDTNRNDASINPAIRAQWNQLNNSIIYAEYSATSQVSGYTAIGSAPSGLFAGNADLDVERSHHFELGYQLQNNQSVFQLATFYRLDRDLTDWTFNFDSSNARSANPVDIDTLGVEMLYSHQWKTSILSVGYSYLHKDEDYGAASVDASFYALNFPNHRATLSWIQQIHEKLELRLDAEYRIQEDNPLRSSDDTATLAYLSLVFRPIDDLAWDLRLSVENLFDSTFEDVPAVVASPRQFALQSTIEW